MEEVLDGVRSVYMTQEHAVEAFLDEFQQSEIQLKDSPMSGKALFHSTYDDAYEWAMLRRTDLVLEDSSIPAGELSRASCHPCMRIC